jgi:hypothetical protein
VRVNPRSILSGDIPNYYVQKTILKIVFFDRDNHVVSYVLLLCENRMGRKKRHRSSRDYTKITSGVIRPFNSIIYGVLEILAHYHLEVELMKKLGLKKGASAMCFALAVTLMPAVTTAAPAHAAQTWKHYCYLPVPYKKLYVGSFKSKGFKGKPYAVSGVLVSPLKGYGGGFSYGRRVHYLYKKGGTIEPLVWTWCGARKVRF